jgi:hypothetical protein
MKAIGNTSICLSLLVGFWISGRAGAVGSGSGSGSGSSSSSYMCPTVSWAG